jgi:hypothetical protein
MESGPDFGVDSMEVHRSRHDEDFVDDCGARFRRWRTN